MEKESERQSTQPIMELSTTEIGRVPPHLLEVNRKMLKKIFNKHVFCNKKSKFFPNKIL